LSVQIFTLKRDEEDSNIKTKMERNSKQKESNIKTKMERTNKQKERQYEDKDGEKQ
jgi:hypothetical protein